MILSDILAEIDEKYPNDLSVASKVRKADTFHKKIYRKLKKQSFLSVSLPTGQSIYPLTIEITDIFQVEVNDIKCNKFNIYPLRKVTDFINEHTKYHYFTSDPTKGDSIGIYPTPTTNETTMAINYYETPITLDPNLLSAIPMLDPDYHMMLVYGVCKEISENYRDTLMTSGFVGQYNALESELFSILKDSDILTVQNKMGW
jgi:hypothetical protein